MLCDVFIQEIIQAATQTGIGNLAYMMQKYFELSSWNIPMTGKSGILSEIV